VRVVGYGIQNTEYRIRNTEYGIQESGVAEWGLLGIERGCCAPRLLPGVLAEMFKLR
jgi:hypothetical protein